MKTASIPVQIRGLGMARYKYENVSNIIRDKILRGVYKAGSKLPSILSLADEMSLNADTVIRAYRLLESEHLIYSAAKSGYYVVKSACPDLQEPSVIDMLSVNPAAEINPYKDFHHCMEKAISLYENKLFTYSPAKGMPELIAALAKHLQNHQIFAKERDIFITTGAQQALYILAAMDFRSGRDAVLVEQPTYNVMLDIIRLNKIPVTGIERTEDGLDLGELERILARKDIKFLYLMPRFQNPAGFSYTNRQKKEILRLVRKYDTYIVEDDYLADLETNPKNDPYMAFDTDGNVIYVKSFSKTLLPGLRLGAAVIPARIQDEFIKRKNAIDLNSSVFSQGALEIYLRSSMYGPHVKRTRAYYKNKMDILRGELRDFNCYVPASGIFACIDTGNAPPDVLVEKLKKSGLLTMGTDTFYIDGFAHSGGIRLCTCKAEAGAIPRAAGVLKSVLLKGGACDFGKDTDS
ncbi:MAG: PLP-dependent aminotransferase family protein [Defluviitaleaceae bacterium]|nr:PLP-dependent aminotransferase family protein [Defluviitaleaceae bacterium]MCL2835624.1 PLP-dependent aminotransferase family protein [Defluviitaleaceae bacterium]